VYTRLRNLTNVINVRISAQQPKKWESINSSGCKLTLHVFDIKDVYVGGVY